MPEYKVRPTDVNLHQKSRVLEIAFDDGSRFRLPIELLRVYSPSAEVQRRLRVAGYGFSCGDADAETRNL